MPNRTPGTSAKVKRCTATEGAQQCLKEQHTKMINHTWGQPGETTQWNEDGSLKVKPPVPDESGVGYFTHPDDATQQLPKVTIPEPLPDAQAADYFNGDNEPSVGEQILGPGAVETPPTRARLEAEAAEIAERRPDVIATNGHQPRPVSLSGAPGSRLADVSSISSTLTLMGIPVELQDEFTWAQICKHAIDSMIEEIIKTRQPADSALVTAAYDAIGHVVQARGLIRQEARS